jgi:tetratricopeptide (TPR) repeat protein
MRRPGLSLALLVALATLAIGATAPGAAAQEAEAGAIDLEKLAEERKRRAGRYPVRSRISRYLGAAAEEVDAEDPAEAKRLLNKLQPNRLNPYERAMVYRLLAYVAYGAGNTEEAIANFEKVLGEEILPIRDEARIRFQIAQLYAGIQNWQQVIAWLERWLVYTPNPDPLGYYLMGIAHYQLEDFDAAIQDAEKAIDLSTDPKESWLRLLSALFAQKEDYASATPVLEELMLRYPKKQYWIQLALIYGARDDYRTSLAVQQVAYTQGFITEDKELLRLARSYLYHELPFPAAKVLEQGLEDGQIERDTEALELLANSWIAAREYDRSLPPLLKAAALSPDGKLYVRLGQVYMQREAWAKAAEQLLKAVEKGGLEDPGNAELLLGVTYYNGERTDRARSYFARARKYESTRAEADRWLTHLETETQTTESETWIDTGSESG